MNQSQPSSFKSIRRVHEAAFSLNVALVLMAFVLQYAPSSLISNLNRLEISVNRMMHIRQTDFITGYWSFFLPGIALALCIWVFLRVFPRAKFTRRILRSEAGFIAVGAPALWWLCATYSQSHRYGWSPFSSIQFYELLAALFCIILYLYRRRSVPNWGAIFILLLHYAFWSWQFWPLFVTLVRGWGGSAAVTLLVGLCSSLLWMLYLAHLEREATLSQMPSALAMSS